jgi:hypothetical protein
MLASAARASFGYDSAMRDRGEQEFAPHLTWLMPPTAAVLQ